jgi:metal-dependent amidase/aminoacylase/carboxypeptidase family protein
MEHMASHAGVMPWNGINALDAAALSYSAIGMLRQQIEPTDRINIVITEAGTASNIITDRAVVQCAIRSATRRHMLRLFERTEECFEGAAHATECKVEFADR